MSSRLDIYDAVNEERYHQETKHGNHVHEVGAWLLIMRKELEEAEQAWMKNRSDEAALCEILQVVACGVACMEQHGVFTRKDF